ncbi:MAG: hypothetical protein M3Z96_05270 [Pseudomonadota bacterium]|nr:hypothetical protein [Pseudomonadota bacterium]
MALALVSVLFFGLLLDLIGPTFDVSAWSIFQKNVKKNKEWLSKILDDDFPNYARDVYSFCLDQDVFPRDIAIFLSKVRRGLKPFRPLEYLLTAYVLDSKSGSQADWLGEQMRLCHMSRAVSATLLLVAMESVLLNIYYTFIKFSTSSNAEITMGTICFCFYYGCPCIIKFFLAPSVFPLLYDSFFLALCTDAAEARRRD